MPDFRVAKVAVRGGGIDQLLDLRYAVPGGITPRKAGEKMPGGDWRDERFDTVIAVSAAEATRLDPTGEGNVVIDFDRGDGVAAVLKTPASGWAAVEIKPIVESASARMIQPPQVRDWTTIGFRCVINQPQ